MNCSKDPGYITPSRGGQTLPREANHQVCGRGLILVTVALCPWTTVQSDKIRSGTHKVVKMVELDLVEFNQCPFMSDTL